MSDETPKKPTGNRVFTPDEMRQAFGRHPMADWKPTIRKGRGKSWMKDKPKP